MLVSTLIAKINYELRGLDDVAPSEGSDEANYWLSVANDKKHEWAIDPTENWKSLWLERALAAPIAHGDNTYVVDTDLIRPSDQIFITVGSRKSWFELTDPEKRQSNSRGVYISGTPKVLNFNQIITANSTYAGGVITIPGYYEPADMTSFDDTVPVDDPIWLVRAVAAEIAFNDTSYEDKAPDILAKANDSYMKMRAANHKGTATAPRTIPTITRKIRG